MNDQWREAPAFLEFAASILSNRDFRLMSAPDRGVCWSMKLEAWVNRTMPADPDALAKILGLDATEVRNALPKLKSFFTVAGGEIRCPELDAYRAHLEARHLRLSEGGKAGAALTNAELRKRRKRKNGAGQGIPNDTATPTATPSSTSTATPTASVRPLNPTQPKPNQSNPPLEKGSDAADSWIKDYSESQPVACTESAYRARRGG